MNTQGPGSGAGLMGLESTESHEMTEMEKMQYNQQMQQQLRVFWAKQLQEVCP